jgi:cob(I)alamin adenosyltransferase
MKIYTKTGDKGETSLLGGKRVPKYHERIEAYGTVDELIAHLGLIRDQDINTDTKEYLIHIQECLMTSAAILAADEGTDISTLPVLDEKAIQSLEYEIDKMEEELPALSSFILPGGHPIVSYCHIARTVCRRAERNALKLTSGQIDLIPVFKYLNRLADYLFVLSRKLGKDLYSIESQWNPQK